MRLLRMRLRLAWDIVVLVSSSTLFLGALPSRTQRTTPIHVFKSDDWAGQAKYRDRQLLVRFRPGTPSWAAQAAHADLGAQIARSWPSVEGLQLVRLPSGASFGASVKSIGEQSSRVYSRI